MKINQQRAFVDFSDFNKARIGWILSLKPAAFL